MSRLQKGLSVKGQIAAADLMEEEDDTVAMIINHRKDNLKGKKRVRGRRKNDLDRIKERRSKWYNSVNKWREILNNKDIIKEIRKSQKQKKIRKIQLNRTKQNEWFGDRMKENTRWPIPDKEGNLRIYGQNVNGISKNMDYGEWEVTLESLDKKQVDIACFSEINLAVEKAEVKYTLREKAKRMDKNIHLNMTCSKTNLTDSTYKHGGVMIMTRGNWAGRIIRSGNDKLGRWCFITLVGKKNRCLTIYSIYRVCDQKNQAGECTIFMQQENDLKTEKRTCCNPREAILTDLTKSITQEREKGHDIIVLGDVNEDLDQEDNRINNFLNENGLYNIIKERNEGKGPATYDRGKKCIDLIAVSECIPAEAISAAGYLPFYDGIFSDHRGSYIDIKSNLFFEKMKPDTNKTIYKRFNTSQVTKCEKYVQLLESFCEDAKIEGKIDKLKDEIKKHLKHNKGNMNNLIERSKILFNKTTQLMKASEKRVGRKNKIHGYPSSKILREAGDKVVKIKKMLRKERIEKKKNEKKINSLEEQLKEMKKELKQAQQNAKKHRDEELDKLAQKRAAEWNIKATQAIMIIKESEASKSIHAKQRIFLKSKRSGGIKQVYVPRPVTEHKISEKDITNKSIQQVVTEPKDICNILLRQNFRDLLRSNQSAFTQGSLARAVENDIEDKFVQQILDGSNVTRNLKEDYKEYGDTFENLIRSMKKATDSEGRETAQYDWNFGVDEYKEVFKNTKEKIACGPSGIHMSHWKAALESEKLMKIHSFFIWSAFVMGHSYDRWELSWHCMLQKKNIPSLRS